MSMLVVLGLVSLFNRSATPLEARQPAPPPDGESNDSLPAVRDQSIITKEECQAAFEAVRTCFAAGTIDDMLPHVRFPEEVHPLMEAWYRAHPLTPRTLVSLGRVRLIEVNAGVRMLVLDIEDDQGKNGYYIVESTRDSGMRVDWEVSARYQEMALPEFQAARPEFAVPFRVHAMLSDYYNQDFDDSDQYLCVKLSYPGDPDFKLWGYAKRDSPVGIRLAAILEFGAESVILDLRYPPNSRFAAADQVEITALRRSSWFR